MSDETKKVFLDTNVISHLTKAGLHANDLIDHLSRNGLKAAVGFFTLYEISVNLRTSNPKHAQECYQFVADLKSIFILPHWTLREYEIAKLRSSLSFNPFIQDCFDQDGIALAVTDFANGIFPKNVQIRIDEIEQEFKSQKDSWKPREYQAIMRQQYKKNDFPKRRDDFYRNALDCEKHRQAIIEVMEQTTRGACIISDSEALLLVKRIDDYPIIRTTINNFLRFDFYTNQESAPSIDKFKDATQILDASYCSYFLSNEKGLLKNHLREVSPSLRPLYFDIEKNGDITEFNIINMPEEVF